MKIQPRLLALPAAAALTYGGLRFVEHRTLSNLPAYRELFDMPLPKLYRWTTRAERAKLRQKRAASTTMSFSLGRLVLATNDALKLSVMRSLGWIPSRDYRGLRTEQTLECAIIGIDRVVDDDAEPMAGGTRRTFFEHATQLIQGLRDTSSLDLRAQPELLALAYTVRATETFLGFGLEPGLQIIWREFTPDALRILAGQPVANRKTLALAHKAYARLDILGSLIVGMTLHQGQRYAKLAMPSFLAYDRLKDLRRDAAKKQLTIALEDFAGLPFTASDLLAHSSSAEELATVPGLPEWCVEQAARHSALLRDEILPALREEVFPYFRPRWAGRMLAWAMEKRVQSFEDIRQWWQSYVPEPMPTKPPAGWLWLAEYYEGGAAGFGLTVSEATKARWRLASVAWFWIDYLLDESPDRELAQLVFRQILLGPTPSFNDLPDWPVLPYVIAAIERWKESIEGLSSYDRIIEMSLQLGKFAVLKPNVTSVFEYARLLLVEDALNGELEAECASDTERTHPEYPHFRRWCGLFFTTCGALDARIDLGEDHRKHQVNVNPTLVNRLVLRLFLWRISAWFIARYPPAFLTFAEAVQKRRAEAQASKEREEVAS